MSSTVKKARRELRNQLEAAGIERATLKGMALDEMYAVAQHTRMQAADKLASYCNQQLSARLIEIEGALPSNDALTAHGSSTIRRQQDDNGNWITEQVFSWHGEQILAVQWWITREGLKLAHRKIERAA